MAAVINAYAPPAPEDLSACYGPDPYDLNFLFPLALPALESARVRLVPFVPRIHAKPYIAQVAARPELQRWFPFDHTSLEELLPFLERRVRRDPGFVAFAVLDKTRAPGGEDDKDAHPGEDAHDESESGHDHGQGGRFAGVIALLNASAANLSVEIGWVLTFPAFQRTHVTSHAIGVLLRACLNLPSDPAHPGLGLRRVQWTAHTHNRASVRAAERMGLTVEGVVRWAWVLEEGKEGHGRAVRAGDVQGGRPGRDSVLLSVCADDWEEGGRERVSAVMERA
ncbi:acyl-CoA N-acyltransferase [Amylostereum chailletii]|nr:acyl-CoA N-acyltransferase [Amylostereum chailletii]